MVKYLFVVSVIALCYVAIDAASIRVKQTRTFEPTAPTVLPFSPFNADEDAEALNTALTSSPDEETITTIFGTRNNDQQEQFKSAYFTKYARYLGQDLAEYLDGDYLTLTQSLVRSFSQTYVFELRQSLYTYNYRQLYDSFCALENDELEEVKTKYQEVHLTTLLEDINKYLEGDILSLTILLHNGRDDPTLPVDFQAAEADAQRLNTLEGSELTLALIEIFGKRSYPQLAEVIKMYEDLSGGSIYDLIEDNVSGGLEMAFDLIATRTEGLPIYFSQQLNWAVSGAGTDEAQLIRVVSPRSSIDLLEVKSAFENLYSWTLEDAIDGDISGSFRDLLIELL